MSHHETRNTTAVLKWCPTCGKNTLHQVSDRRQGTCMNTHSSGMSKDQERRAKLREEQEKNPVFEF